MTMSLDGIRCFLNGVCDIGLTSDHHLTCRRGSHGLLARDCLDHPWSGYVIGYTALFIVVIGLVVLYFEHKKKRVFK